MKKGVLAAISTVMGAAAGATAAWKVKGKNAEQFKEYADKHLAIMLLYNQWLMTKQEGKSMVSYFKEKGYQEIAVYGMSYVGERVLDELKDSDVDVKYAIDKKADQIYAEVEIVSPEDELEDVDAIVVTSNFYFDVIEKELMDKVECPILNLEDILYEL